MAPRLPGLTVGPFTVREPVVALVEAGVGAGNDDGTLGIGFFERVSVTFDFAGRALYLVPNKRISEHEAFDAGGIVFRKNGTSYEVDFIVSDSSGSRAAVREGDGLLQLDGRPVDRLTLLELRNLMSHRGDARVMTRAREQNPEYLPPAARTVVAGAKHVGLLASSHAAFIIPSR